MIGFLVLMIALVGLICAVSYWISWELQDRRRRVGFTRTLWNDAARLFARKNGGIPASGTQFRAADDGPAHCPGGETTPATLETGTL